MYRMIWHQVFSNYKNLNFKPNSRIGRISIKQNLSGRGVRVEFSNKYDQETMWIIKARVSIDSKMHHSIPLTLNDQQTFEVPAGQSLWSDLSKIDVPLKSSLYLEFEIKNKSNNLASSAHTFSNKIFKTNIDDFGTNYVYGVTSVAIQTEETGITVGFFGDSLTNQGYYADSASEWFYENVAGASTINEGISGNRLLLSGTSDSEWSDSFGQPAVERFGDLVKYQPDIAVVLIGDNDLYQVGFDNLNEMPKTTSVITALKRIKNQAIVANITPILVTLTPFKGALSGNNEAWTLGKEIVRNEVNDWIRKEKMMIDLDKFVRNENDQRKLSEQFDSEDHLHFSKSGGKLIGEFMAKQIVNLLEVK